MKTLLFTILSIITITFLSGCQTTNENYDYEYEFPDIDFYETTYDKYIYPKDGDTLVFDTIGTVRLYYIDTPESFDSTRLNYQADKCAFGDIDVIKEMGVIATSKLSKYITIDGIYKIDMKKERDLYGRILARVSSNNNETLQENMVRGGWAVPYFFYTDFNDRDFNYEKDLLNAMADARINNRGFWSEYPQIMECLSEN